jgi:hypothetical protein
MAWSVEFLNEAVREALDDFPPDIRASFQRIVELIQSHGLERVREPYLKHLEGPLWEMRMKGKGGIARAIYVTAVSKQFRNDVDRSDRHLRGFLPRKTTPRDPYQATAIAKLL